MYVIVALGSLRCFNGGECQCLCVMIWNGGDKCNFAFAQIVFEFFFVQ